jgi:hypothetical protein
MEHMLMWLLSLLSLLCAINAAFGPLWVAFAPHLGIGFAYCIATIRLVSAALALGLGAIALWLHPTWGQGVILAITLLLVVLSRIVWPWRMLPALDRPCQQHASASLLASDAAVIGWETNGVACAWPLEALVPHHLVNDQVAGQALLVAW